MVIERLTKWFEAAFVALLVSYPLMLCAQTTVVSWFDGQQERKAWVNDAEGSVALSASGEARFLRNGLTIVTESGQAAAVRQALDTMQLDASTRLVPDRVYLRVAPEEVLSTTFALQNVAGIRQVRLQWAARIAAPERPQ